MSAEDAPRPKGVTPTMIASAEKWIHEQRAAPPRWQRALRLLLDGESLTARSAAKEYGEWNLRETVRELERQRVKLAARPEISFSAIGSIALRHRLVLRYTLRPESRSRALDLLRDLASYRR